jgi:hypothetical protein
MMRPWLLHEKWRVFREDPQYAEDPKWVVWDVNNQERLFNTGEEALTFLNAYLSWYEKTIGTANA